MPRWVTTRWRCRVTDSGDLSDTQSFTVTVDDVNEAPVADPGPDHRCYADTVTLDGVALRMWTETSWASSGHAPLIGSKRALSDATSIRPLEIGSAEKVPTWPNDCQLTKVDSAQLR